MRSIAFLSQKGGSGKTTLAVHVAVAALDSGERVLLLDTDPQGSASAWAQARSEEHPLIEKATASGIGRVMEQARRAEVTLSVIDTAPHAIPGVDAIAASVQVAKAAGKPAAFVLNACPARAPEIAETREVLTAYGLPLAPVEIGDRRAFTRAVARGRAVTEFEAQGKAAGEITRLWRWIRKTMTA